MAKPGGRVIYRELMHNGQALSTFRTTNGKWLSEPTNAAWLAYGSARSGILDEDQWPHLARSLALRRTRCESDS
jgi:hypothetical protein